MNMNEIELAAIALRIETTAEQEAYLSGECSSDIESLARAKRILSRAQDRIPNPHELGDAELRLQIRLVIREMDAEEAKRMADRTVDLPTKLPDSHDSHQDHQELAPMRTETFATTDQTTSLIAGRYKLQNKIGEGGMGEVWRAKQSEPIKRYVALKLIKKGMDSKAVLSRFEQERQALAVMDHPNIARVFDGGITEQGQPFFAMELVVGSPLNEYADKEKLTTEERLNLFVLICNAVQHAHQKGIVHRDLKPANILVTTVDGKPVPKVIDFGVAKAIGGRLTDESMNTQFGAIVGTLEYMAPEQAGHMGFDIDTRVDIYSLGVVLYELLTGLRPIDRTRLQNAGLSEMIRVIKEDEPSKPSTRLSTSDSLPSVAAVRRIEPKKLTALLRGELDWVVMKCLEKQRDRRYETANSLARDIQRYLSNEIVEARPPSRGYRLKKFISKYRSQVISASFVMIALMIGTVAATLGLLEAQRQTRRANLATEQKDLALQKEAQQAEKERIARLNAEVMTKNALDANKAMVFNIQEELAPKPGMQDLRIKLLRKAREGLTKILAQNQELESLDTSIVSTYLQLGDLEWNLGDVSTAKKEFQMAVDLAQRLSSSQSNDLESQKLLSDGFTKLGDVIRLMGDTAGANANFLRSLEIDRAIVSSTPKNSEAQRNLSIDLNKLGDVALRQGDPKKALEYYLECFDICKELVNSDNADVRRQRDLSGVHNRLGDAKTDLGDFTEALAHYKSALLISKGLVELHPDRVDVQRDYGLNSSRVGKALLGVARPDEALNYYNEAINSIKPLVDADPQNAEVKRDLGGIYERLGDTALELKDTAKALEHYENGLKISKALAALVLGSSETQRDLSVNNEKLGDVLMALGQPNDAHAYYKTAMEISERLAVADPNNIQAQSDVGYGYLKLGNVMTMQAKFDEATKYHRRALDLRSAFSSKHPDNAGVKTEAYRSHFLVGESLLAETKFDDALSHFRSALRVLTEMIDKGWYTDPEARIASRTVEENRQQLNDYIWLCENAVVAAGDIEFVMAQEPRIVPRIMRVRIQHLVKSANSEEAFQSADKFATWIESQQTNLGELHYEAGGLYALCVSQEDSNLEKWVVEVVKNLEKARAKGYFDEANSLQLKQNPAFAPVRSHPKFANFMMSLLSTN